MARQRYTTTSPTFATDFMYDAPWELAAKAIDFNERQVDAVYSSQSLLGDALNVNYLEHDASNVNAAKNKFNTEIDEVVTGLQKDPTQWRKAMPKIQNLGKEIKTELSSGKLGNAQKSYASYQQFLKENEDTKKKDPQHFAEMSNLFLKEWKEKNPEGSVGSENVFTGGRVFGGVSLLDKKFTDILKDIKPDEYDVQKGLYLVHNKVVDKNEVTKASLSMALSDSEYAGYIRQRQLLGDRNYTSPIFIEKDSTGKTITTEEKNAIIEKYNEDLTKFKAIVADPIEMKKYTLPQLEEMKTKLEKGLGVQTQLNPENAIAREAATLGDVYGFTSMSIKGDTVAMQRNQQQFTAGQNNLNRAATVQAANTRHEREKELIETRSEEAIKVHEAKNESDVKHGKVKTQKSNKRTATSPATNREDASLIPGTLETKAGDPKKDQPATGPTMTTASVNNATQAAPTNSSGKLVSPTSTVQGFMGNYNRSLIGDFQAMKSNASAKSRVATLTNKTNSTLKEEFKNNPIALQTVELIKNSIVNGEEIIGDNFGSGSEGNFLGIPYAKPGVNKVGLAIAERLNPLVFRAYENALAERTQQVRDSINPRSPSGSMSEPAYSPEYTRAKNAYDELVSTVTRTVSSYKQKLDENYNERSSNAFLETKFYGLNPKSEAYQQMNQQINTTLGAFTYFDSLGREMDTEETPKSLTLLNVGEPNAYAPISFLVVAPNGETLSAVPNGHREYSSFIGMVQNGLKEGKLFNLEHENEDSASLNIFYGKGTKNAYLSSVISAIGTDLNAPKEVILPSSAGDMRLKISANKNGESTATQSRDVKLIINGETLTLNNVQIDKSKGFLTSANFIDQIQSFVEDVAEAKNIDLRY